MANPTALKDCNCNCLTSEYSDHALTCPFYVAGKNARSSQPKLTSKDDLAQAITYWEEQHRIGSAEAGMLFANFPTVQATLGLLKELRDRRAVETPAECQHLPTQAAWCPKCSAQKAGAPRDE
jgi:hypothetical protein